MQLSLVSFLFSKKSSLRDRLHQYQQLNKEILGCLDEFKFNPETDIILILGDLNLNARCAKYPKDFVEGFPENVLLLSSCLLLITIITYLCLFSL